MGETYILDSAHELVRLDTDVAVELQHAIDLDARFLVGGFVACEAGGRVSACR